MVKPLDPKDEEDDKDAPDIEDAVDEARSMFDQFLDKADPDASWNHDASI